MDPVFSSYCRRSAQAATAAELKFAAQRALFVRLREFLADPARAGDAEQLLRTMRRNDDLFARVATQIDAALDLYQAAR